MRAGSGRRGSRSPSDALHGLPVATTIGYSGSSRRLLAMVGWIPHPLRCFPFPPIPTRVGVCTGIGGVLVVLFVVVVVERMTKAAGGEGRRRQQEGCRHESGGT